MRYLLMAAALAVLPTQLGDASRITTPITPANFQCGFPPFPPFGCRVGDCVCDQYGRNCRWTFVCG